MRNELAWELLRRERLRLFLLIREHADNSIVGFANRLADAPGVWVLDYCY